MAQLLKFVYAIIFLFSLCLAATKEKFHSCVNANDCPYDFCSPPKYAKCVYNSCYCEDQGRL
ncbi:putative Late nodulin [Medicago truncatula]|uniref:Late nodulin n=1 Tax=Medicago truncatula TaxID=3880 RepID=G7KWX3_MEDTR|nr:late nodulin [Medicago truncatula]RHN45673.1 putative Late nodulin [Medicago truncatula]